MEKQTKAKISKIIVVVSILALIALVIYLPLKLTGTLDKISSAQELKDIILSGGAFSYIIFCLIQFLQTTILPIPAIITTLAGVYVFGPWIAFWLSIVSVLLGSLFSFFLGRTLGTKIAYWIAGEESTKKWQQKLEKGKYVFFLMMLFPLFPDDILCLVVGATTSMTYRFFITTNLITRPIAIASTCFFGSGLIIPFSGWGIPVWIVLIALMAVLFFVSIKYESQIENLINKLALRLSKKEKSKKVDTINKLSTKNSNEQNMGNEKTQDINDSL